jgi:hypothetical protein
MGSLQGGWAGGGEAWPPAAAGARTCGPGGGPLRLPTRPGISCSCRAAELQCWGGGSGRGGLWLSEHMRSHMTPPHLGLRRPVQLVLLGLQAQLDLSNLGDVLGLNGLRNHNVRRRRCLHVEQRLRLRLRRRAGSGGGRRGGRHGCYCQLPFREDEAAVPMGHEPRGQAGQNAQITRWSSHRGRTDTN